MNSFLLDVLSVQPSQLHISQSKLDRVREWFKPGDLSNFEPLPIKDLGGRIIFTDGHTRAYAAYAEGIRQIPVYWDTDDLDWEAYDICVDWCKNGNIRNISDLKNRIVNDDDYKTLWYDRCSRMHDELEKKRSKLLSGME